MKNSVYLREASRMLLLNKQRTFLALLGILIGIGSVIAMVSIGEIIAEESMRQFRELGTDLILIEKQFSPTTTATRKGRFDLRAALGLPGHAQGIAAAAPVALSNKPSRFQGNTGSVGIVGSHEGLVEINKLKLKAGRFLVSMDDRRQVAVVGHSAFESMKFSEASPDWVGKSVEIDGRIFAIVGVLEKSSGIGGVLNYDINRQLVIPITTAMRLYGQLELSSIATRLQDALQTPRIVEGIKRYFSSPDVGVDVQARTPREIIEQMQAQGRMFTLLLGAIGSIAMVVGGVGIMNIMLVSVAERRREIGIRRALGARRRDIQIQFLLESILLSLAGGVLGTLIGIGVAYQVARSHGWVFQVSMLAVWAGLAMANLVGVVFGFFPARQAAQVDPIKALQ
ncbi:MAG: ABC transporter permease [Magnetococcales bacterium]|nr:ABC transporter permease [Magnetococcales bacterium]